MKKLLTILLLSIIALSSVFAEIPNVDPATEAGYKFLLSPYKKTSARLEAMGGAGIVGFSNQDALYFNPASLGKKGIVLNTPNIAVTLYNFQALYEAGIVDELIQNADKINTPEFLTEVGGELLQTDIFVKQRNALLGVDAGVGFKFGRFAFAVDVQSKVLTYNPDGQTTSTVFIPTVDAVASAGLGFRFFSDHSFNFDLGLAARFNVRAFSQPIKAEDFLKSDDPASVISNTPMYVGFSIPIDVGLNVNFPLGFSVGTVLRNINGKFDVAKNGNYEDVMNKNIELFKQKDFTIKTPMSLDFGFGWNPNFGTVSKFINPSIVVDFVDLIPVFKDFSKEALLLSIRAGVEVELLTLFELRAGINQGYYTIGAGFNLFNVLHLEASYYRLEFGNNLGDAPVDALTIRFNTLWER